MKSLYCIPVCFFLLNQTFGQPSDSLRTELLRQVTITATRSTTETFRTAGSISVLTAAGLQTYQPRSTPEALLGTTGAFVQKTTHGAGSPFLRGLTGNQTLILIDGIRLNNSTFRYGPNQYLNTVDPFTIDKIEVLRGGGSVAYGSDALGGTVQLLGHSPALQSEGGTSFHGKGLVRYATGNMEKSMRAEAGMSSSGAALQAGISIRNFGDLIGGDTTGKQSPSGYKEHAFDLKALIALAKNWTVTLSHQSVAQRHVPLYYRYQLENFAVNEFDPQKRSLSYFKLNGKTASKWASDVSVTGSFQATNEGRISRKIGSNTTRTETDKVRTAGFIVNVQSELSGDWTASSGIEVYHDVVYSNKVDQSGSGGDPLKSRGLYPDHSKYLNYALFSLHQLRLNDWQFSFGGRFNGFSIHVTDEVLGKVSVKPKALVGSAAISYLPTEISNFYFSFNSGFRAPNIDDMGTLGIVDFRYELPAYDLKPETSYNFEAGYKVRTGHFALGAALFNNKLHNLIARVQEPGRQINGINVYRKENIERAYIRGAEAEAEFLFDENWKAYGSAAYAFGENVTHNEPVRRIPPLNGRFGFEYRKKGWYGRPELLFADQQSRLAAGDAGDNRIPKGGTPGWSIYNLMAGYDASHFSVSAVAQNLTNNDYRLHGSGINGVGRSLWLTITGRF